MLERAAALHREGAQRERLIPWFEHEFAAIFTFDEPTVSSRACIDLSEVESSDPASVRPGRAIYCIFHIIAAPDFRRFMICRVCESLVLGGVLERTHQPHSNLFHHPN